MATRIIDRLNRQPKINTPVPTKKTYAIADQLKAVEFKVTLSDGTVLFAEGGHAADVYNYLMDCERHCASTIGSVSPYLGPGLLRLDDKGNKVVPENPKY